MKAKDEEEHASISELRRSEWKEERPEWTFVQGLRHYPRDVAGLLKKKQPFLGGTMYEKLMVNGKRLAREGKIQNKCCEPW